ncbi:hypothetical protein CAPTEDRAFT_226723 [Capitella teleta]|uniref:C2H2-type domain-containing protein n=1 Tax=Capitella teleta TaxID=283909 RepID=R7VAG8_CAPTE|nr:hypothetical protein CAPTEDRAFT_226723 [Capitella teleta]|eukprot:ELU15833.1 hypothetical protein CAPTEDRAFT_226723 [Capitella teleta]
MGSIRKLNLQFPMPFLEALQNVSCNAQVQLFNAHLEDNSPCSLVGWRTDETVYLVISEKDGSELSLEVTDQGGISCCVQSGLTEKAEPEPQQLLVEHSAEVDNWAQLLDVADSDEAEEMPSTVEDDDQNEEQSMDMASYQCPEPKCSKICSTFKVLNRHVNTLCHKNQSNFKDLLREVEDLRPYRPERKGLCVECPYCQKERPATSAIRKHMQTWHSDEKDYEEVLKQVLEAMVERRKGRKRIPIDKEQRRLDKIEQRKREKAIKMWNRKKVFRHERPPVRCHVERIGVETIAEEFEREKAKNTVNPDGGDEIKLKLGLIGATVGNITELLVNEQKKPKFVCPAEDCFEEYHQLPSLDRHIRLRHVSSENARHKFEELESYELQAAFAKVSCPFCPSELTEGAILKHMNIWHSREDGYEAALEKCHKDVMIARKKLCQGIMPLGQQEVQLDGDNEAMTGSKIQEESQDETGVGKENDHREGNKLPENLAREPDKAGKTFACPAQNCAYVHERYSSFSGHVRKCHKKCANYHELCCFVEDVEPRDYFAYTRNVCPICQRVRPGKSILKHVRVWHSQEPNYQSVMNKCVAKVRRSRRDVRNLLRRKRELLAKEGKKFQCSHCDKMFVNRNHCIRHVRHWCLNNPDRTQKHLCQKCSFKSSSEKKLSTHMTKVHGDPPKVYTCETCNTSYKSHRALTTHRNRAHEKRDEAQLEVPRSHVCEICGWISKREIEHKVHIHKHSANHTYVCHVCGAEVKCHVSPMDKIPVICPPCLIQCGKGKTEDALVVTQIEKDKTETALGVTQIEKDKTDTALGVTQIEMDKTNFALGVTQIEKDKTDTAFGVTQIEKDKTDSALGATQGSYGTIGEAFDAHKMPPNSDSKIRPLGISEPKSKSKACIGCGQVQRHRACITSAASEKNNLAHVVHKITGIQFTEGMICRTCSRRALSLEKNMEAFKKKVEETKQHREAKGDVPNNPKLLPDSMAEILVDNGKQCIACGQVQRHKLNIASATSEKKNLAHIVYRVCGTLFTQGVICRTCVRRSRSLLEQYEEYRRMFRQQNPSAESLKNQQLHESPNVESIKYQNIHNPSVVRDNPGSSLIAEEEKPKIIGIPTGSSGYLQKNFPNKVFLLSRQYPRILPKPVQLFSSLVNEVPSRDDCANPEINQISAKPEAVLTNTTEDIQQRDLPLLHAQLCSVKPAKLRPSVAPPECPAAPLHVTSIVGNAHAMWRDRPESPPFLDHPYAKSKEESVPNNSSGCSIATGQSHVVT